MAKIIAISNQKGGVGKTTTAVNLSACLAEFGMSVLLVDIDPQGNATSGLGVEKNREAANTYRVLIGEKPIEDAIVHTAFVGLDVVPSTVDLAGAEALFPTSDYAELFDEVKKMEYPAPSMRERLSDWIRYGRLSRSAGLTG